MQPGIFQMVFFNTAAAVLPWLLAGLVLLGAVSFSPLGRLWIAYLRERHRDSEALDAMLSETSALRGMLGEVIERLDATERRLAAGQPASLPPVTDRITTPV